jgi:hypothetical protein
MNEIVVDYTRLSAEEAPKSVEEFRPLRSRVRIFKNGITNENALELNLSNIKNKLPDDKVNLSFSLENDNMQATCRLHDYVDYCLRKRELELPCYELDSGRTYVRHFTNEPIYLFQYNCEHEKVRSQFVSCPSFLGDWFDKYLPIFRDSTVYGHMHTWFFIGPKGTKSEMHADHDFIHTTIQQLDGTKRFFLLSPQDLITAKKHLGEAFLKYVEFELITENSCKIKSIKGSPDLSFFRDLEVFCGDIHKHELVYLPNGWGHYAKSLSPSLSVSRDFIDETNIDLYFFSGVFLSATFERAKAVIEQQDLTKILMEHELLQEA